MKKNITIIGIILLILGVQLSSYAYDSEYKASQSVENGHVLVVDGHSLEFKYSSGAYGTLYDNGEYIDSNMLWNFYSNGKYVYYSTSSGIIRFDLDTRNKITILHEDDFPFIEGIYSDKYLYYGSSKYGNITYSLQDLIIYDLENQAEIGYIEDVGDLTIAGDYIYTIPCSGDICPLPLQKYNLDGSNAQLIAEDAVRIETINNQLFYAAVDMSNGYYDVKEQVRKYNSVANTHYNLTDYYNGYIKDIYTDHAIFTSINSGDFTIQYNDSIKVYLNGNLLSFDQPPVIKDDRTLVPLRAIFEDMGATVDWDGNTQTVTSTKGSTTISITINSNVMFKNGVEIYLDVPAQLVGDYTMVPVRAVAEAFGSEVNWDGDARTVYIDTSAKINAFIVNADAPITQNDAALVREVLIANKLLPVDENNIHSAIEPSEEYFNDIIDLIIQCAGEDDITYFFYSGHGGSDGSISPTYNKATKDGSFSITPYELLNILNRIPGKIVVFLDSCYSGTINNLDNLNRDKFKIITSSDSSEYSNAGALAPLMIFSNEQLGAFTEVLLNGLGGLEGNNIIYNTITGRDGKVKADFNKDNNVTLSELYQYIVDNIDDSQSPTISNINDNTIIYSY